MTPWRAEQLLPYMQTESRWRDSGFDDCAPADQPFRELVAPGLHVLFTRDMGGETREFLRVHHSEDIGIEPYELLLRALTNLQPRIDRVEKVGRGPAWMLRANGTDEACLMLLAQFWEALSTDFKGELLVAVPAQAVLLFCDSADPAGVAALQAGIRAMREAGEQKLSEAIFVRHQQRWLLWPQARDAV